MNLVYVLEAAAAGLGGAVVMTLFEFPFWKKWGMTGVAEWQVNWLIISKLSGRISKPFQKPRIAWIIALHLTHGVIAGILFLLLLPFFTALPGVKFSILLDAVGYGVALWAIFSVVPRGIYESALDARISDRTLLTSLFSLLVYGIFLGLLLPLA